MNNTIYGQNFNQVFRTALEYLTDSPDYETAPRGMKIKELINATLVLENPMNRLLTVKERDYSLRYLAGELCFYLSGSEDLSFITHYSKFWEKVSDDGKTINSNYGARLFYDRLPDGRTQFEYCRDALLTDPDSRKAVAFIYYPTAHSKVSRDNPCTQYLQFFIRDSALMLITNMRSNDVWFGLSYDLPFFCVVQEMMLRVLKKDAYFPDLQMGPYIHNAGSLHLYERNWEQAEKVSNDPTYYGSERMPSITMSSIHAIPKLLEYEKELRMKCVGSLSTEPWTDWVKNNLWKENSK